MALRPVWLPSSRSGFMAGAAMLVAWLGLSAEGSHAGWQRLLAAALGACLALGIWVQRHRAWRRLEDAPLVPIGSAAQGHATVAGVGRAIPGMQEYSPLTGLPCLWYRLEVEERDFNGRWHSTHTAQSSTHFEIADATGRCRIDPGQATITASLTDVRRDGDTRSTQWVLVAGARLYAQGWFVSRTPGVDRPSRNRALRDKLAGWKASGEARERFDLDRDGSLDLREWDLARAAAHRAVLADERTEAARPGEHTLGSSPDGRPLEVFDIDPHRLVRRLRWQARGALLAFFALLTCCGLLYECL